MRTALGLAALVFSSHGIAQPMILVEACNLFGNAGKRLQCLKVAMATRVDSEAPEVRAAVPAAQTATQPPLATVQAIAQTPMSPPPSLPADEGELTLARVRSLCEEVAPGLVRYKVSDVEHPELTTPSYLTAQWEVQAGTTFACRVGRESRAVAALHLGSTELTGERLRDAPDISMTMAVLTAVDGAAPQAVVLRPAWDALTPEERRVLLRRYAVNVRPIAAYGIVTDVQVVNESTPGTNSGAMLGAAVGSAAYLDRSFRGGNNYSAMAALGVGLLGALIGSAVDRPPETRMHLRYTFKLANDEVLSVDRYQNDPFRHPVGSCVHIDSTTVASSTSLCGQSAESVRKLYLNPVAAAASAS